MFVFHGIDQFDVSMSNIIPSLSLDLGDLFLRLFSTGLVKKTAIAFGICQPHNEHTPPEPPHCPRPLFFEGRMGKSKEQREKQSEIR